MHALSTNQIADILHFNDKGEYQTKENPGRIIWEHYTTVSPEKDDSSREEGMNSLPKCEWTVAESQRGMTQDKVKTVCQDLAPWKTGIFLRERVKLFIGGWVSCCPSPKEAWRKIK